MRDSAKTDELLELLFSIRNACQHPDADPQLILAAASASFAVLRERWEAVPKPDEQS